MGVRRLLLLWGLLNGILYAALLPLWEGFDEAFHYSYVETLERSHRVPILGKTLVELDVENSFRLAPVSHIVKPWLGTAISFSEWFTLPISERERRRASLDALGPFPGTSSRPNYEAHHAPLAYLVLAFFDWLASPGVTGSLLTRVLLLRLIASVGGVCMAFFGTSMLARALAIPKAFENATLFTVLSTQMLYATVCHVANDWLATGIAALFLAALANTVATPSSPNLWRASALLAVGLWTKAYFLVFLVAYALLCVFLAITRRAPIRRLAVPLLGAVLFAAPWYTRNLLLYGNLAGTHEAFQGFGVRATLDAAKHVDWISSAGFLARASLWTGNGSFLSFSRGTLNTLLAIFAVGGVFLITRHRAATLVDRAMLFAGALFVAGIGFDTAASFAANNGDTPGASPWYSTAILALVVALVFLGLSRAGRLGSLLAVSAAALSAWTMIATWSVKLLPYYASGNAEPMRASSWWKWVAHDAWAASSSLTLLAMVPAPWIYAGAGLSTLGALGLFAAVIRPLLSVSRVRASDILDNALDRSGSDRPE